MNARRLTPRLWGLSHDPRTLRDLGISADELRDDSKPLKPLISERWFAFVVVCCAAVACVAVAIEVL